VREKTASSFAKNIVKEHFMANARRLLRMEVNALRIAIRLISR